MSDLQNQKKVDLVISRIVEASLDMVWRAWTDPEQVKRWWGPKDYSSPSCSINLREGGQYIFCMQAPPEQGGVVSYTSGLYTQIIPKRLLEFTQFISDAAGNPLDPQAIGLPPDFPKILTAQVSFEPKGSLTKLIISVDGWTESPMFVFAYAGWNQQTDKLEATFK